MHVMIKTNGSPTDVSHYFPSKAFYFCLLHFAFLLILFIFKILLSSVDRLLLKPRLLTKNCSYFHHKCCLAEPVMINTIAAYMDVIYSISLVSFDSWLIIFGFDLTFDIQRTLKIASNYVQVTPQS
ncbi:hypothetical protein RDI58_027699 [Solanum bulbocastanum]|uniref:Uncharacterized protein n=1 Tax=Solanum bulbocastanum TaxID=147425 RepID=A0AAN8Y4K7_SOLBU